jgi:hypothetical protein
MDAQDRFAGYGWQPTMDGPAYPRDTDDLAAVFGDVVGGWLQVGLESGLSVLPSAVYGGQMNRRSTSLQHQYEIDWLLRATC